MGHYWLHHLEENNHNTGDKPRGTHIQGLVKAKAFVPKSWNSSQRRTHENQMSGFLEGELKDNFIAEGLPSRAEPYSTWSCPLRKERLSHRGMRSGCAPSAGHPPHPPSPMKSSNLKSNFELFIDGHRCVRSYHHLPIDPRPSQILTHHHLLSLNGIENMVRLHHGGIIIFPTKR